MYHLNHVCDLFHITPMTLYRWMKKSNIKPRVDPVDNRRKYLNDREVGKLAKLHHRVLVMDTQDVQRDAFEALSDRIKDAEDELKDFNNRIAEIERKKELISIASASTLPSTLKVSG